MLSLNLPNQMNNQFGKKIFFAYLQRAIIMDYKLAERFCLCYDIVYFQTRHALGILKSLSCRYVHVFAYAPEAINN